MDNTNRSSFFGAFDGTNIALVATTFVAGMYVGRKLTNTVRRVTSLISVGPTKMALVVRKDLKMSKGKIVSQCCHGTLAAYQKMERTNPRLLQSWLDIGQTKVVVKATDLQHLQELSAAAKEFGVQEVLIRDAGRTQVQPGSATVLVVGPGPVSDVEKITGKLQLL